MPRHIQLLVATATAAAAGGSAAIPVVGDSLTVKNALGRARIISAWADFQAAGFAQIVRPSGHDTTRDYRFRVPGSEIEIGLPMGLSLEVSPQELLSITLSGAAVAGDVETIGLLMEYENLRGIDQRLIDYDELLKRTQDLLTLDCTLASAVGPAFATSEELITAESDLLKANTDYAVIGYRVAVECAGVYVIGDDTGNVRVGGPGNDLNGELTSGWFGNLSRAFGRPMIPVINSGNKANTRFGCHQDENATAVPVSWILARLRD